MNKQKSVILLFIPLLLGLMFLPLSTATIYYPGNYASAGGTYITPNANDDFHGITFTVDNNYLVTAGAASISGSGNVKMLVYHYYNTSVKAELIGVSTAIATPATQTLSTFNFTNPIALQTGQKYAIGCIFNAASCHMYIATGGTGVIASAEANSYTTPLGMHSLYVSGSEVQVYLISYGLSIPEATPTPTPSPTPTPFTYQGDIWAALTPYGTMILPLVLILLVALLCGRYAGVWGFFAGLNIAAILVYAIMGAAYLPLWGLVMLALVDGLLLFGKISGRM